MARTVKRTLTVVALVLLLMVSSIATSSYDVRAGEKVVGLILVLTLLARLAGRAEARRAARPAGAGAGGDRRLRLTPVRTRAGAGL